jgi:hypothetical protein
MEAQPLKTPIRAEKVGVAKSRALEKQVARSNPIPPPAHMGMGKADDSSDEEMMGYGKSMAEHIRKSYGERFHKHFMKGMGRVVAPVYGNSAIPGVPVGFNQNVSQKAHSKLSPQEETILTEGFAGSMSKGAVRGRGKLEIVHHPEGHGETIISGGSATGRFEGQGKVDKRKSRGAMLKKIMAEQGCNMIQATKYMKEHSITY